jgi:hypothetical protein
VRGRTPGREAAQIAAAVAASTSVAATADALLAAEAAAPVEVERVLTVEATGWAHAVELDEAATDPEEPSAKRPRCAKAVTGEVIVKAEDPESWSTSIEQRADRGNSLMYASVALQQQGPKLRAAARLTTATAASAAFADAASADATTAEPAMVVLERVQTAADVEAAARACTIDLDDDAADPPEQREAKRRRVEPAALTALPIPQPADQEELERLRAQLTARRPSMIYELQGVALEEPIPHPEGLPPLLDPFSRVKAAVGKLRRGKSRDPMRELLLLRRCVLCGPAQTVMAVAADMYESLRAWTSTDLWMY